MAELAQSHGAVIQRYTGRNIHDTVVYRGADKSLARPRRKQARKQIRDKRDFNNIETRALFKIFFLQGKAPKENHGILAEILACFLAGRAKDLSAPLYYAKTPNSGS
jgi:hypothetical protein